MTEIGGESGTGETPDRRDSAPGEERITEHEMAGGLSGYLLGFGLAILLTIASFLAAQTNLIYQPAVISALVVLAVAQMGVHLVFFLHLTTGRDNTNNVLALAFGVLIVALVVLGSVWIMAHLDQNMAAMTAHQAGVMP
ncbi:cytochrome o ubiquinol oxidase subunit IV [Mesorhizobium sp. CO1-1-7]|uniref:Cytochrome bo(3) ubiquinol oxidase subunit 4 n=1 Tax=Mesorhizobium australicum (strain HAMBI 3006 / LMG 24608 / WSM2073) TaxID=754035 RepID=L0KIZ4_MESAW|nr:MULTISPECIES: cytochrome o ubiquinol oxidase subunit IV [Mesorhizobium]MBZ9933348.1 cytochrome o ubiquinol oxidase subunit IV [Mesorhizobium sp. BR1-1-5]AGB44981.1 cytochrome o ubiquinol oxidase subunit IV [Mesorhizobium australicum WSM2073]MBZ9682810.1 cytochrome o ubiquinol oxidase subunit IV [Mesorhizobium sp. CO1-1-2]MBZ9726072.1 cytochrome o ubiquinol oxidase subunit IV [Mesorhizobium sp. CO1-1-11]MBZ9743730.1 cytochrome o ubiquinol oxidase subunit IV [Mesorhizobium sp. CO1-1-7]